jgi:multiple sugar transport system substrate-binding protein
MTSSKKAIIALILVFAMLALAACAGTGTTTTKANETTATTKGNETTSTTSATTLPPTEISFWNGWTGPDGTTLQNEVKYFNDNNKENVTVKMDIMQHAALTEKMHAALASNTAPNLHLNFTNGEYAVNNQIVAIDTIWENTALQKSDFVESILDQMYYKDHLLGIPFQLSSLYLYWNKDIFKNAGLDPEAPPKTWEDMITISKKTTDKAKNIIGGGGVYNNSMLFAISAISYGGKIIEGDTMDTLKAIIDDPKYIAANRKPLENMLAMIDQGSLPPIGNDDIAAAFNAGTCAMYISGAWTVAGAKAAGFNWGISLLPAGSVGIKQPGFPIAMICMKGTEGNKLIASYKFIEFWNDNLSNKYGRDSSVLTWSKVCGYQPYLKSVANNATLTSDPIFKVTNSYVDYLEQYRPTCFYNFFAIDSNSLVPMLENIGQKRKTIDEAMKQANIDLQLVITDMQESGLGR